MLCQYIILKFIFWAFYIWQCDLNIWRAFFLLTKEIWVRTFDIGVELHFHRLILRICLCLFNQLSWTILIIYLLLIPWIPFKKTKHLLLNRIFQRRFKDNILRSFKSLMFFLALIILHLDLLQNWRFQINIIEILFDFYRIFF